MADSLYIVVHHQRDYQNWDNNWADDDCIRSITTTAEVAEACRSAGTVYVHRCGWKHIKPSICCAATVDRVSESGSQWLVTFKRAEPIGVKPEKRLFGGMRLYHGPAPS